MKAYPHVKINLGLNVLRKRSDGYHDLETLMIPYEGICDELSVEQAPELPDGSLDIRLEGSAVDWDPHSDLTAKAYRILCERRTLPGTRIRLVKNAPVGAGLGGGSSDGASALKLLNELYSLRMGEKELIEAASKLGSDCAFFIPDRPCMCSGRGEILEPFNIDLSGYEIQVRVPGNVAVRTSEAYSGIIPGIPRKPLREVLQLPVEQWKETLVNDFEASVFPIHPEIRALKSEFYESGAIYASMSGSGSSVFGLFKK